jgi:hypothetical protein
MKRSAPIAAVIFCGVVACLPILSTAVLCSGLIRVRPRAKSKESKGPLLRAAPFPDALPQKKRAKATTA